MAVKQVSAFDALIVRQAFEKLADSVTFTHQTQRTLRQAAHELAEQAVKKGQAAKQSEGGREGSLVTRNAVDQSKSNIPPHPSVVAVSALVPVTDDIVQAVADPMHEVIFGNLTEASVQRLHEAVATAIAPKVPAESVNDVTEAIVLFALTRRELVELAKEFPELVALENEWSSGAA